MFPFSGHFLHLTERSRGNWRGLTVGKIAAGTLHSSKQRPMLRCLARIDSSAFAGFLVFGDALP
jgi:hypothetical protein